MNEPGAARAPVSAPASAQASAQANAEYTRRMHRVLADQRLSEPLPWSELAEVAHFSPYQAAGVFSCDIVIPLAPLT